MSKFKTVSCNKYHKIIELHIINILYNKKNVLTDIFLLKKIARIPLMDFEHTVVHKQKTKPWENATE